MALNLNFENHFSRLPPHFYTKMKAEAFATSPYLIHGNVQGARLLGLGPEVFADPDFPLYFSGNKNLPGAEPLAMVYAGHQFGMYVPQLGDGRALLLGQVRNQDGELWDIQLKGSGITPYSRFADGRAVLRSCIREYLCGEALHALGIPTTRSLCVVGTGEQVAREQMEPGAILTRIARSHIRFGHFEYFYYTGRHQAVRELADHVMEEHFPHLTGKQDRYLLWYREVTARTARLVAQWQACGFAHGVLNTDNMSIIGLTIDYGPFGFMERFDPGFICNHSDETGRYAFDRQPTIALWNLYALAHALQPLFPLDDAKAPLDEFGRILSGHYHEIMARKLGLKESSGDVEPLIEGLLSLMEAHRVDYTLTLRALSGVRAEKDADRFLALFRHSEKAKAWFSRWQTLADENAARRSEHMKAVNPKYILRNWIAETVIRAAEDRHDYSMIDRALEILNAPFAGHPDYDEWAALPPPELENLSVSCSS